MTLLLVAMLSWLGPWGLEWDFPASVWRPLQDSFNVKELSDYRLTDTVFKQFVTATQVIVTAAAGSMPEAISSGKATCRRTA